MVRCFFCIAISAPNKPRLQITLIIEYLVIQKLIYTFLMSLFDLVIVQILSVKYVVQT